LKDREDKILSLACGRGKTVCALLAAAEGGRFPVLVVVHTEPLMDQWRKSIQKFLAITPDKIGIIQQDKKDCQEKEIAVAMLHTLVLRKYDEDFYKYWNLIIFDEVHKLGAETFSRACSQFVQERWGLSATVDRADGMDMIFRLHLGGVYYKELSQDLKPTLYFVHTPFSVDSFRYINGWTGRVNIPKLLTALSELPERNEFILKHIHDTVLEGRTILVLGDRLLQLRKLHAACNAEHKSLLIGAMKPAERLEALNAQVVFASQQLAKEGLDRPAFDTLFILAPFADAARMQQSIGRILRSFEGKKEPFVFVIVDDVPVLQALSRKMQKWAYNNNMNHVVCPLKSNVVHLENYRKQFSVV
jgi:superfamily II DNA or RNA helicase